MNPLRAIITAKNMILIVPVEAESLLNIVYEYMKGEIQKLIAQSLFIFCYFHALTS